jgi:hypothetical protein
LDDGRTGPVAAEDPAVTAAVLEWLGDDLPSMRDAAVEALAKAGRNPRPHDLGRDNPAP